MEAEGGPFRHRRRLVSCVWWVSLIALVSCFEIVCVSALRPFPERIYRVVARRELDWIPHDRICSVFCIGELLTGRAPCFELVRPSAPRALERALFFAEA